MKKKGFFNRADAVLKGIHDEFKENGRDCGLFQWSSDDSPKLSLPVPNRGKFTYTIEMREKKGRLFAYRKVKFEKLGHSKGPRSTAWVPLCQKTPLSQISNEDIQQDFYDQYRLHVRSHKK